MDLKIERQDLNEQVYHILKNQILTREYKGGARLDLNDLSDKMGVSKTPVKLAIHRLANDGLVEVVSRSGTYVTQLTGKRIAEVMDARIMIEKWSIEHLSKDDCEQLVVQLTEHVHRAKVNLESDHFDYQQFLEADVLFHKAIVTMSHNQLISNQYELLNSFLYISRIFHFQNFDRSKEGIQEHAQLIEVMKQNRLQHASDLLVAHLEKSKQYMIYLIEENGGAI
ncbi:GntR family transcriptional regulator [Paenibacillus sp. XY044]|uniref:GntR family transcriptional regulator n=1 Tax=Paenibacillus sp. XY044 TaxID=2026089 RepID=UPI0015C67AC7|nr:GntR family transcriptional regulator [Paenibacillus sp. XY044]